jgi:hypothetical protein
MDILKTIFEASLYLVGITFLVSIIIACICFLGLGIKNFLIK